MAVAGYRSLNYLREERCKQSELRNVRVSVHLVPVKIYDVGCRLECVKGYSHRNQNQASVEYLQPESRQIEPEVFQRSQYAEINDQDKGYDLSLSLLVSRLDFLPLVSGKLGFVRRHVFIVAGIILAYLPASEECHYCRQQYEQECLRTGKQVEHITRCKQNHPSPLQRNAIVQDQGYQSEYKKIDRCESHGVPVGSPLFLHSGNQFDHRVNGIEVFRLQVFH